MADPAANYTYPSGLSFTWGCPVAEAGLEVETVEQDVTTKVYEQMDNVSEPIEIRTYDRRCEISVTGQTTGSFAFQAGVECVIANLSPLGGVSSGLVICKSVKLSKSRDRNQNVTITATQYPLIAATVVGP